jgi:hypothetical protein
MIAAVSPCKIGFLRASLSPSATTSPVSPTTMTQPKGASGFPRAISTARRM